MTARAQDSALAKKEVERKALRITLRITMTRFLFALMITGLLAGMPAQAAPTRANIVIDGHSGKVLSRYRPDRKLYPASLVKLMTIYLLLEEIEAGRATPNTQMTVSSRAADQPRSKLYLRKGEKITAKLALEALIVRSANDVAMVVAEHISGNEEAFIKRMNLKARSLGMLDTQFANPSGLYNWNQVSTVRDMARLARALLRDFPDFKPSWSQTTMFYRGERYSSHNNVLRQIKGAVGMKTGYIRASGYNVVAVTERDGRQIITVVIGGRNARERDRLAKALTETNIHRASIKKFATASLPFPRPNYMPPGARKTDLPSEQQTPSTQKATVKGNKHARALNKCKNLSPQLQKTGWSVQLGAYESRTLATQRVQQIKSANQWLSAGAAAYVPSIDCNGQRLYRARIAGLSESVAKNLCAKMANDGSGCFTLAP